MIEQLKTVLWYLKRPRLYPQFAHFVKRKLSPGARKRDNTKAEMGAWCSERGIDTNSALEKLTGMQHHTSIQEIYTEKFIEAKKTQDACPVRMGGPGDLDLLYYCTEHLNATKVIETGVAYGWSSFAILLSLSKRKDSRLISSDMPYPKLNNEPYVGCVVPEQLKPHWELLRYADRQALPKAIRKLEQIDMCHYDSDKSYDGRMWAYPLLWKIIKSGGFFISDDIGDNVAFRDFCIERDIEPIIIRREDKYIGVIIKS